MVQSAIRDAIPLRSDVQTLCSGKAAAIAEFAFIPGAQQPDFERQAFPIVIWKLDRLARSLTHLIKIAGDLKTRGIDICSLTDSIDTSTASGELHFHMLAASHSSNAG